MIMKKFDNDYDLIDELISIIRRYESSKGEDNISIDEVSNMVENHNFTSKYAYMCALDVLENYNRLRQDCDWIGERV